MIDIKRVYDKVEKSDGYRIYIDRLWPRGLSKNSAHMDTWVKEIAPTTELRKWFGHDTTKWNEFKNKYLHELDNNPATADFIKLLKDHDKVTLLFSARDSKHNNAVVLLDWLKKASL